MPSCPVLYRYSEQTCYTPAAMSQAERQMPGPVVNPIRAVAQVTNLPLTAVAIDWTSGRRGRGPAAANINYVFGQSPNLGLPLIRVPRTTQFLVVTEAVGRVRMTAFNSPQLLEIHIGSDGLGRTIRHLAVNLPGHSLTLVIHTSLAPAGVGRVARILMGQSARAPARLPSTGGGGCRAPINGGRTRCRPDRP
ncbi:MAG: hypothetical protein NVS4B2_10260 [Chloroflexota bacterium]